MVAGTCLTKRTSRRTMTSSGESSLQRKCLGWLKARPDFWVLKVQGGLSQEAGVPDLLICARGRFVAVELKRPDGKGRLSGIQRAQLDRILNAGGVGVVIDDFDEFVELMESV
jgi:hypothetical protein